MSFYKLANDLEETARQSANMVDGITAALAHLSDDSIPCQQARAEAATMIVIALQAQDRIEQRCRNMAEVVREFAQLPPNAPHSVYAAVWHKLRLDELRVAPDGTIPAPGDDIELF